MVATVLSPRRSAWPVLLAVGLTLAGCNEQPAADAPAGEAAAAVAPKVEEAAFVLATCGLRRAPTLDKKVADKDASDKLVANWITNLYRGEQVLVVSSEGEWSKVKTSADQEGYLQQKSMLRSADAHLTTALAEAKAFRRPDLTTVEATAVVEPGSLLFALQEKDQFTKIDFPRSEFASAETWILTERLTHDEREVAASKLVTKLRYLKAKNDPTAATLEDLARSQFGGTKVIETLDAKPADAPADPAAPGAPAPDGEPAGTDPG